MALLTRFRIAIGILGIQAFSVGRCQQIVIGCYKGELREAGCGECLIGDQGRSQLHGVVAAQLVVLGQAHGPINDGASDRYQCIFGVTVTQEESYRVVAFLPSNAAWRAVFGSEGRKRPRVLIWEANKKQV